MDIWYQQEYSRKGNKRGVGSLTIFPKFSRLIRTKVNKISKNTEVNIDKVEQKTLLTIGTTKLHRYYRVTLHFLDFHQKKFPEIPPPLLLPLRE